MFLYIRSSTNGAMLHLTRENEMEQTFTFTDGAGRKIHATLTVTDNLREIAFTLAKRARRQGRKSVKALEGAIELRLEVEGAA